MFGNARKSRIFGGNDFATRFGKKKSASQRANVLVLLGIKVVTGAGFPPFRTPVSAFVPIPG
jgi:hypothetical protein